MSSDGYRVVGVHGPPTKETAPHGVMYRGGVAGQWFPFQAHLLPDASWGDTDEWYPLPPPPVEQAPAPEPVARWRAAKATACWTLMSNGEALDEFVARGAAIALNTLDRDGVCYGPGRPPEELDESMGWVLYRSNTGIWTDLASVVMDLVQQRPGVVDCWWPLPESGE